MAELRAYEPTWRDRLAGLLMGDGRASPERRRFVEGLLGSSGLGSTGISVSDLTPLGIPLGAQEAMQGGDYRGAAMAAVPVVGRPAAAAVKGAAKEGKAVLDQARNASTPQSPAVGSRANPTPDDINAIYARAAELKDAPYPDAKREIFKTTPEAYAETEKLVPQVSVRERLPNVDETGKLPNNGRAQMVIDNADQMAANIAERLDPLVRRGDNTLKFYDTGPVIRGGAEYGGLSLDDANAFMRDWAGQGAATSPRTATPQNLRNSSYLLYNRANDTPVTREIFDAQGNRPGFRMMGMHVDLADKFAKGAENPLTNPKPFTFRENWSGNLRDVTGDTHNIRSSLYELDRLHPGQLPREFFSSDDAFNAYRSAGGFQPNAPMNVGGINDSLGDLTVNKVKRQAEYGVMTDPWYRAAGLLDIAPARAQSGGWFSYGDVTGLRSPPKTIPNLLNDQVGETARVLGVPEEKAAEWWFQKKIPLAGVGGAAIMPGLMGSSEQEY